jgi:hypothetical protein
LEHIIKGVVDRLFAPWVGQCPAALMVVLRDLYMFIFARRDALIDSDDTFFQ